MYMKSGSSKKKMDYFLGYYQLYYWKVRGLYDTSGDVDLFREITQIINDTFTTVNSNLKLCKSIVEAEKIVKAGEDEIMKTLKSKAPQLLQSIGIGQAGDSNDALHTIVEEEDGEPDNSEVYHENKDNVMHGSFADSASDDEPEENEVNGGEVDDESESEDDDSAEEQDSADELIDTDDDESERKEAEREIEDWSMKSKPKLMGKEKNFRLDSITFNLV